MSKNKSKNEVIRRPVDGNLSRKLAVVGVPPLYQGYALENWKFEDILRDFMVRNVEDTDSFMIIVGKQKLSDSYKVASAVIEQAYLDGKSVSIVGLNSLFNFYQNAYKDRSAKAMLTQKLNHSELMAFSNLSDDLLNLTDPEVLKKFRDFLKLRFHRKQKTIICTYKKVEKNVLERFFGDDLSEGFKNAVVVRV